VKQELLGETRISYIISQVILFEEANQLND